MNPITVVFQTRQDFDVVENPYATIFAPFVGKNPAPQRSQSKKSSLDISSLSFL